MKENWIVLKLFSKSCRIKGQIKVWLGINWKHREYQTKICTYGNYLFSKVWGLVFFPEIFLLWIFHLWPLSQIWCFRKRDFHPNFCAASKWASLVCRIFYQGLGQKTCNDETYWRDENKFMKKRFWLLCEADFGDFGSRLKLRKPKDFCFLKLCSVIIDIGIFTLQSIVKTFGFYWEWFPASIIFVCIRWFIRHIIVWMNFF